MTTEKQKVAKRAQEPTGEKKIQKPYKCQMFLRYYGP